MAQIRALALALAIAAPAVHGAGGHHAVDDAVLLDAGQCEFESWFERESGGARNLLHAGLGCRVGPVELGVAGDRQRMSGAPATTTVSPQVKWARQLDARWSAGVVLSAVWQTGAEGRYQGSTVLVPVSWRLRDDLALHVNAGRDFVAHEQGANRTGIAAEWAPLPSVSLLAERFRQGRVDYWRLGGRWSVAPGWSVDLSRAAGVRGGAAPWWTLGVTRSLGS